MFQFKVISKYKNMRAGIIKTPHGEIKTPIFMPVGTKASVKALSPQDLLNCKAEIILGGNTYHMYFRPGIKIIEKFQGLHNFMYWDYPMLTDSGGFQVASLQKKQTKKGKKLSVIKNEGVYFYSLIDGSKHFFSPEKSIKIQKILGADIIMAFDECTPNKGEKYAYKAMQRTHQWLERSIKEWGENQRKSTTTQKYQALFGIIQGGDYKNLRQKSAEFIASKHLPGIAVGGETIGQNLKKTKKIFKWIKPFLPQKKPIYLMGLGRDPQDIITAIKLGVDIFDCVAPTRMARNGNLYSGKLNVKKLKFETKFKKGRLNIRKSCFKNDLKVIDKKCQCPVCKKGFNRAYLHHLFKEKELLYYRLASIHNIFFMINLCKQMRKIIIAKNRGN